MRAFLELPVFVRVAFAIPLSLVLTLIAAPLNAEDASAGAARVPLFAIRKSENRNQVVYSVTLDASCRPLGSAPVRASWRMLERGPEARESLARIERRAYGIASQRLRSDATGVFIDLVLRALPDRRIVVRTTSVGGGCAGRATTPIDGVESAIEDVFVQLRGPVRVDYVELRGRSIADGSARVERLRSR